MKVVQATLISFAVTGLAGCIAADNGNKSSKNEFVDDREANQMYKKLATNMMVENVNSTVDYYKDVLGFEFVIGVPENSQEVVAERQRDQELSFAILKSGNIEMMFQARKSLTEEIPGFRDISVGGSLTFYIEVGDVKRLYSELKNKATIVRDLRTTFYGKQEFYIRDCNGYILCFAGGI